MRDHDRNAVYSVESGLEAVLDRGGIYNFYGSVLDVAPDRKFVSLAEIRFYLNTAWGQVGMLGVPPNVRERLGNAKATYRPITNMISLPAESWSMREMTLLHELSHAIVWKKFEPTVASHGQEWRNVFVYVTETLISREAALILRSGFDESCVWT